MVAKSKTFKEDVQGVKLGARLGSIRKELQKYFESVPSGDPESIHQARVKSRRWAVACKLLQEGLGKSNSRRMIGSARKPARRLGEVRSVDVCLALAKSRWGLSNSDHWLIAALSRHRAKLWKEARRNFASRRIKRLFEKWQRWSDALEIPKSGLGAGRRNIIKFGKQWKRCYAAVLARPSASRWHKLRIATKKWRYALEGAQALGWIASHGAAAGLKDLQAALGLAHDEEVLNQYIEQAAAHKSVSIRQQAKAFTKELDNGIRNSLARASKIAARIG